MRCSRGSKAYYEIIQGTLEDLAHLPFMPGAANANVPHSQPVHERDGPVPPLREGDGRNEELFNRAPHWAGGATASRWRADWRHGAGATYCSTVHGQADR